MSEALVIFEQPVNERVRTFLRLEFLFRQFEYHSGDASEWGRRASVQVMLDILTLFSRADLKKEIGKELGDQAASLSQLAERPEVDASRLQTTLDDLAAARASLAEASTQETENLLRDSEFLLAIINRSAIPGGACPFDLPGYRRWLTLPVEESQAQLASCVEGVLPFQHAIRLFLSLLRQSAPIHGARTEAGMYTQNLDSPCRLIRIALPEQSALYPEISAGRQRFTVRFRELGDIRGRDSAYAENCEFGLALCSL